MGGYKITPETRSEKKQNIINKLNRAGIDVKDEKRVPKDGQFSGIVGKRGKILTLDI